MGDEVEVEVEVTEEIPLEKEQEKNEEGLFSSLSNVVMGKIWGSNSSEAPKVKTRMVNKKERGPQC